MRSSAHLTRIAVLFFSVSAYLGAPAARADDYTWEATPVTTRWGGSANWAGTLNGIPDANTDTATVSGIPTNGLDPLLDADYTIGALTISANGDVNLGDGTNNFRLIVQDNGGESGLTLIQGAGSTLDVYNSSFSIDFDTDDLTMNSGGFLDINSAVVQVDRAADINTGATIAGDGEWRIDGTVNAVLNGTLRASGGTLTVSSILTAQIDLDGDGAEGGTVAASSNSTLIINTPVTGPVFNGTIDIGANAEIQINSNINLQSTNNIEFSGGAGTATYSGSPFTMVSGSIMNINSGTAVMAADFTANAGANINFSANTTLQFDAPATIADPDGISDGFANIGYTVNDVVNIGSGTGTLDWDGFSPQGTTRVNDTGVFRIDVTTVEADPGDSYGGTLELFSGDLSVTVDDGAWEMDGTLEMRNNAGSIPTIDGSAIVVGGNVNARGTGASQIQVPSTWNSSSNTNVSVDAVLVLGITDTDSVTYAGGSFTGPGELEQGGDATVTANTTIDTAIFDWDRFTSTDTTVNSGVTFTINSTLADAQSGTVSVNSGTLAVNTPWSLDGTLILENTGGGTATLNGSELSVVSNGDVEMRGTSVINSDVRINGGLTVSNGSTADINGQTVFGGSANVSVPGGETLDLNGVTEFQGGSHSGGGTVNQFSNSRVTANTVIDYSTYNWDGLVGGQNVVVDPNVAFVLNVNNIDPDGGGNTDMDFNLRVGNGATVTVNTPGPWGVDNGVVDLQSPPSLAPTARINGSNFVLSSFGRVQGNGVFTTNVRNEGTFAPGASSGNIVVNGNYQQTASGELEMEIQNTTAITGHDQLNVVGNAELDGTLDVTPFGGYTDPAAAGTFDEFTLILAAFVSGTFDDFVYDGSTLALSFSGAGMDRFHVGDGLFRIVDYDAAQVDLLNYQALVGDADGNGAVDGSDFGIWNANKFTCGTDWTTGDFSGDGCTDGTDFGLWNTNKFTSINLGRPSNGISTVSAVPEPGSLCGLIVMLVAAAWRRR